MRAELARLVAAGAVSVPVWRAGRAFVTRRVPGAEHAVLHVREADETERTLLDVMAIDPSGLTTLDSWVASVEGDRLAYQLSAGGNKESLLHVLDVATGQRLDGPIDRCRYSPVAWVPGGVELYYVRRRAPRDVPPGEEQFHRRVWRHRVGADPGDDVLVHGEGLDPTNYYGVRCSADGRWLLVDASAAPHRATRRGSRTGTAPGSWSRPTPRAAPPGWAATGDCSCAPPSTPRAGGSASPTRPVLARHTGLDLT